MWSDRLAPARFVLLLGGRGALLARAKGRRLCALTAAALDDAAALASMARTIAASPRLPLTVLLDVADMVLRKEAIPAVGLADRSKLLRRRLDASFPEIELRGALPLPKDGGPALRRELPHLFAAVPAAGAWVRWRPWLEVLPNPRAGLGVLPLKLQDMALALAADAQAKPGPGDWTLLLCRHWTGGVRQIVLRGREPVLTRLTPTAGPTRPAPDIVTEVRATLGYLARLGFGGGAVMRVVGLGPAGWGEALEDAGLPFATVTVLDARTAAARLRVQLPEPAETGGDGPDPDHADPLSLAMAARHPQPVLDLSPALWRSRGRQERLARVASLTLAVLGLGVAAAAARDGHALWTLRQDATRLSLELSEMSAGRDLRLTELGQGAIAPGFAAAATGFAETWSALPRDPTALLSRLATELPPGLRVDRVAWTAPETAPARLEALIRLDGSLSPAEAVAQTRQVVERLGARLAPATVVLETPPVPLALAETLKAGPATVAERANGYTALIVVRVPATEPPA